ncbi:J domain-containing protein [Pseudoxanthomonas sp. JBR18]|uniref:J domain-containing protein n=1 Tax=Pseudoxanthomonas sp. JBR18 TaxID=2969308 RepID=UPI002305331C|nr:J domain-containing protein [Pseudoxanthomonas sp. JBR18]WCE03473.1 J domain-containing protein [Pseudoxanthomonas sp. JBR18]
MNGTPWDVLGITRTADAKVIRRAYAAAVKKARPDEDAEGFQRLTDAFEWAIEQARQAVDAHEQIHECKAMTSRSMGPGVEPNGPCNSELDQIQPRPENEPERSMSGTNTDADHSQNFEFKFFFKQLVEQVQRRSPPALRKWLQEHPDLYSAELKWSLIVPLFSALANEAPTIGPQRGHINVLIEFFEVDIRSRKDPNLGPILDYLESGHWRSQFHTSLSSEPKMSGGWGDLGGLVPDQPRTNRLKFTRFQRFKQKALEILLLALAVTLLFWYALSR